MSETWGITYRIGSSRVCPVCDFTGRKFKPAGTPPRPESMCPKCGARERHRLLSTYIDNETTIPQGDNKILYFAPREPIEERLRRMGNVVVTTDLSQNGVNVYADITKLPFDTEAFDVIICSHVLEHVPEDSLAMKELNRVLKTDGYALILIPKDKSREKTYEDESITSPQERAKEFGQYDHVRVYGRDVVQRFETAGFNVAVETYAENFTEESITKHGLQSLNPDLEKTKYEDIHHCRPTRAEQSNEDF